MYVRLPHRSAQAGVPVVVEIGELTVEDFVRDMPDLVPGAECWAALGPSAQAERTRQWEQWQDAMLARALISPKLTAAEIARLGADREALGAAVLAAWGIEPGPGAVPAAIRYGRNFRHMVRQLARWTHRLPSEILALPTSAFWFNWTLLFGKDAEDAPPAELTDA